MTTAGRPTELAGPARTAVESDVRALVALRPHDPVDGSTVGAADAAALVARHGLASLEELALAALPVAREMARAPISGYRVAAVGIEAEGGLVLGANLEFPGTDLATTIHAEGFVPLRARRRGRRLATLALVEARPCAHCRQTLSELAGADALTLVDLLGHRRTLADLYPWPFRPEALGVPADDAATVRWPALELAAADVPPDVAGLLLEVGGRAHAPYTEAPSAVAMRLADGRVVAAGCVESVAFNPSIAAVQAALVEVAAARAEPGEVVEAWLARASLGPVDPEPGFRAILGAVAPGARIRVVEWAGGTDWSRTARDGA